MRHTAMKAAAAELSGLPRCGALAALSAAVFTFFCAGSDQKVYDQAHCFANYTRHSVGCKHPLTSLSACRKHDGDGDASASSFSQSESATLVLLQDLGHRTDRLSSCQMPSGLEHEQLYPGTSCGLAECEGQGWANVAAVATVRPVGVRADASDSLKIDSLPSKSALL